MEIDFTGVILKYRRHRFSKRLGSKAVFKVWSAISIHRAGKLVFQQERQE